MYSLPDDMESRRLADLKRFAMNHPDHPMVPMLMEQVKRAESGEPEPEVELGESKEGSFYQWLRECEKQKPASKGKRQFSGKLGAINRWDKSSSLELLAAMKNFEANLAELSIRGIRVTSDSKWATIAQNLPNRYGLEQAKFTRSCKVHFAGLCRVYKVPKRNSKGEDILDPQVRRALDEYFDVGGENVHPLIRKGLNVKSSADRGENVNISDMPSEKSVPSEKHSKMDVNEKIPVEKHSNTMPDKVVNDGSLPQVMKASARPHSRDSGEGPDYRVNQNSTGAERVRCANEDPPEQEVPNPHRREQRVNPPPMDRGGPLKRWDTASTLQLLAALARIEAKSENRWETIASHVPNHGKLDPQGHIRSCKEQYRDLLSVYKRASCKENSGQQLLPDEVYAQLHKWLQLSTTSKDHKLRNTEAPRAKKWSTAPERSAAKPAVKPVVIEKKNDEERMGIPKKTGFNKMKKCSAVEENHEEIGLTKSNRGLPTGKGLDRHAIGRTNGSSLNDSEPLDPNANIEKEGDECRGRTMKRSREQQEERHTHIMRKAAVIEKKGKLQQVDVKGKGICKTYTDNLYGRSGELEGRKVLKSAPPNCKGLNQAVNIDKASRKDNPVHVGSNNRGREVGVSRGGASLKRTLREKGEMEKKHKEDVNIRVSKRVFYDEETTRKNKLKEDRKGDAKGKGLYKPFTPRVVETLRDLENRETGLDQSKYIDDTDDDGIAEAEHPQDMKNRAKDSNRRQQNKTTEKRLDKRTLTDGEMMTSRKETEIDGNEVCKTWGTTDRIEDTGGRKNGPLPGSLVSSLNKVTESDNRGSWDDSIHLEDTCKVNPRRIKNKSTCPKGIQRTKANISYPGKRIFSSGPQNNMTSNKHLHSDNRKGEENPLANRPGNLVGVDRSKFQLGSDLGEDSWDDSMHEEEDDSVMDGAQSRWKARKRLKILKRMIKKRVEREQAEKNELEIKGSPQLQHQNMSARRIQSILVNTC